MSFQISQFNLRGMIPKIILKFLQFFFKIARKVLKYSQNFPKLPEFCSEFPIFFFNLRKFLPELLPVFPSRIFPKLFQKVVSKIYLHSKRNTVRYSSSHVRTGTSSSIEQQLCKDYDSAVRNMAERFYVHSRESLFQPR